MIFPCHAVAGGGCWRRGWRRGRTERTCSGSGSCGLLSGVLLLPPRSGEPAEVSAWPAAGAVGNPSSLSDRLFSWSISLGERGVRLARRTGGHIKILPLAQLRARPPARSDPLSPARGGSRAVTLGCDTEAAVPRSPRDSRPRVAALPL